MIAWHASSRWHCSIFHSYLLNFQLPDDLKVFFMDVIHAGVEYYNNHAAKPFCHPYTPFLCNYYQFVHNGVCSQLLHIGTVLEICTKLYHQHIKR